MSDPKQRERMLTRDKDMADNILTVLGHGRATQGGRERKGLAWLGSLHVADSSRSTRSETGDIFFLATRRSPVY